MICQNFTCWMQYSSLFAPLISIYNCIVHSSLPSCSFCSCNPISQTQYCVNNNVACMVVFLLSFNHGSLHFVSSMQLLHWPFINFVLQLTLSQQQLLIYTLQVSDCAHRTIAIRFGVVMCVSTQLGGLGPCSCQRPFQANAMILRCQTTEFHMHEYL